MHSYVSGYEKPTRATGAYYSDWSRAPHIQYARAAVTPLQYHWLHIPTSNKGVRETDEYANREDLLAEINRWNADQPGVWQYWLV